MYEQYTDKQIVEMLVPKLMKAVPGGYWDEAIKRPELNRKFIKAIATVYRSAYIRGQLGRSFIIGEKKQTEHWVPATKDNVKVGSKVKMIDEEGHRNNPWCLPNVGTLGIVTGLGSHLVIQWPKGSTSENDRWYCDATLLEVLLCE